MLLSLNQASAQAFERGLWRELRRELQKNRVKWMLFMGEKKKRLMPQMLRDQAFRRMVPVVGLEPTRCRHRRILNPLRLPFHHTGTFYRETPKILIGENKERTHYKSHILLYLGSLEKSRFLSDFILPDLLAFESATSTNSITPAGATIIICDAGSICKQNFSKKGSGALRRSLSQCKITRSAD